MSSATTSKPRSSKNSKQASEEAIRTAVFLEEIEKTKVQKQVEKKKIDKIKKDFFVITNPGAPYKMSTFYTDLDKEQLIVWAKYLERVNQVYAESKVKLELIDDSTELTDEMAALTKALDGVLEKSKQQLGT